MTKVLKLNFSFTIHWFSIKRGREFYLIWPIFLLICEQVKEKRRYIPDSKHRLDDSSNATHKYCDTYQCWCDFGFIANTYQSRQDKWYRQCSSNTHDSLLKISRLIMLAVYNALEENDNTFRLFKTTLCNSFHASYSYRHKYMKYD